MNYVYLDSKYHEYLVDDQTYATIVSLVQQHKHCLSDFRNRHEYTKENPCVGKNMCLEHLLQKQSHLTRIEVEGLTSDNQAIFYFVDTRGMVYTSTEDSSTEARPSLDDTLTYYGFFPPKTITARGKSVEFYSSYATLYGDLHTASVIVLSYHHPSEKVKGLFLLYKNGPSKELTKRNDLYTRAEEVVLASKDAQGAYHIGGNAHAGRFEAKVYEVISLLESAVYDVTRRLQSDKQSTDEQTREQE
jgi:hypothetical protein